MKIPLTLSIGEFETPPDFASRLSTRACRYDMREFCRDFGINPQAIIDGDPEAVSALADVAGVSRCQATPTFTSYGDIQSYEVSHDESGPGRRADRKSQSALPGAADHFVEIGAISSSARLRDRVAGNCAP